tara:strand:+ start:8714 stop:9586 length:873 start_codon:yes stop_codon:yes gene_type:complete
MENKTLITVLGWEDRFILGTDIILKENNIQKIVLISFTDYADMNIKNKSTFIKKVNDLNIEIEEIKLNYSDSINNWKIFDDFFEKQILTNDILLNITTMPRETIWALLFFLKKAHSSINYIYFKPEKYCDTWLTKNHKNPRLLFKHSGVFDLNKNLVLFIITGFDDSRLSSLIEYYEPSKVVVLNQVGDQFDNEKRNNGSAIINLLDNEKIEFDSYDVNNATKILSEKIKEYKDCNVIISSQGPKISSISTYKNYILNNNIALAYVPARDFNDKYSVGIDENYISGIFNF